MIWLLRFAVFVSPPDTIEGRVLPKLAYELLNLMAIKDPKHKAEMANVLMQFGK